MQPALLVSGVLLCLFTIVASLDGLYYHLYKYRLYARAESRKEHWLHTVNAVIFPGLTYLLYCVEPRGFALHLAWALFLITFAVEVADVRCEYASRASLGGLTSQEYFLHFLMAALRFGGLTPLLTAQGLDAYSLAASSGARPLALQILGYCIVLPGVGTALLHIYLGLLGGTQADQTASD